MDNANVGLMLSTTLKNYRKTLVDNIFKSNAVFYHLRENGAIKEEDGGERIVVPLMYGKNDTARSYSGYESLDTTPQEGIDSAEFNWKQYSTSITISGEEERKNSGSSKIIDILDSKTKQAEMSLTEKLAADLFADGTGNGGKNITGLGAMVNNSGIYGGINSGDHAWWRAYIDTNSGALAITAMRTAFNTAGRGGKDTPDLITTSQTLFEKYEALLASTYQVDSAGTKKLADAGFQALEFKGRPVVWDELHPAGAMYFLNSRHMKISVHKDANFETTKFVRPENQDARVAQILFMGNVTCNRRASFAGLLNKTA